jgi:hypothetical protein
LHLVGEQVGKQAAQLVTLGAYGVQFPAYGGQPA